MKVDNVKLQNTLWLLGDLSWKLHPGQLEIYRELYKHIEEGKKEFAFRISRQYGKSYLTVVLAIEACIKYPNIIVRILGPTLDAVAKIVEDNLVPIIRDAPKGLIKKHKSDKRYNFSNGSSLRIGTLERAHIDATARGGNSSIIFLEECAASVKSEDLKYAIESVINPQLLRSSKEKGGGLLVYITTPSNLLNHYFHEVIEPPLMLSNTYWCRTIYDNPQLSSDQIKLAMKRCGGEHSEAWQREYLCRLFRSEIVTIIPEFNVSEHIKELSIPIYKRMYTIIDFGGSKDCTSALLCYWDFDRKKFCIIKEVFAKPQTTTVEIVRQIVEMEAFDNFGVIARKADMPGLISVDLNQTYKFTCSQVLKDDASGALQNVRSMLYNNEIEIDPRCAMLIKTLLYGNWNKSRTDYQRTDELGHCDAIDALVYACRDIDKKDPRPVKKQYDVCGRNLNVTGFDKLANLWGK